MVPGTIFLKRIGIILLTVILPLFLLLSLYIEEERMVSHFKEALSAQLSQRLGVDVTIGDIRGNIFKDVTLQDIGLRFKDYDINFKSAKLNYSIWDTIAGRGTQGVDGSDILIDLKDGSLKLKQATIIGDRINGRIRLFKDKAVLDDIRFELFSFLDASIKGEVIKQNDLIRFDLALSAKPFSMYIKGGLGILQPFGLQDEPFEQKNTPRAQLNLTGDAFLSRNTVVSFNSDLVFSGGIINIDAELALKDLMQDKIKSLPIRLEVDTNARRFRTAFAPEQGSIIINGDYSNWGHKVNMDITNEHLKIYDFDFSNIVHLSLRPIFEEKYLSRIGLDIYTESTIINYTPFDELEGSLWIDRDILNLTNIKIGDDIQASGVLSLKDNPQNLFLKIEFLDLQLNKLFAFLDSEDAALPSGRVSGRMMVEGTLNELMTKANLNLCDGSLGTIDYKTMFLNLKGSGPTLTVYDSRLIRDDLFLAMDGTIDIRLLGKESFLDGLTITTDANSILWNGWSISKTADDKEYRFARDVGKDIRVGFRKQVSDETVYQSARPQSELELEYKMLDKDGSLQFKSRENEEILGIIKKHKF